MSLYIHETGTQGAPTIVFIHGVMTNGKMWESQQEALTDFHCLTIDLPGHGRSNHLKWVSSEDSARQIAEIIRIKATGGKAHIVGLSLGAYVVLYLMLNHADCLNKAIISGAMIEPMPNRWVMSIQIPILSLMMRQNWFINWQAKMLHIPADKMDVYVEGMRQTTRQTFLHVFDELLNVDFTKVLHQVQTPILVVAGELEVPIITTSVKKIVDKIPYAEGRLAPHVHHGWAIEAPLLFSQMVRAWFTNHPLPQSLIQL